MPLTDGEEPNVVQKRYTSLKPPPLGGSKRGLEGDIVGQFCATLVQVGGKMWLLGELKAFKQDLPAADRGPPDRSDH